MTTSRFRFNCIDPTHLGGGVVLFRNAVDLDWDWVRNRCEEIVSKERDQMYREGIDPETGEKCFINKSGYIFDYRGVMEMPRRGSAIWSQGDEELKQLLRFLEQSKDSCLLEYFYMFPLAYKVVWWKVKGHIVSYSKERGGSFLGQHSDNSVDYAYGIGAPADEMPTRNSISAIVYFNDQANSVDDLNDSNFIGGNHTFNYLGISYSPKKGDIMMFPSNFMAAHLVEPVTAGTRYSYLGWYSHGTPNPAVGEHVVDPSEEPDIADKSTNVLLPRLREDFINYLEERTKDKSHHGFTLTRSMHS